MPTLQTNLLLLLAFVLALKSVRLSVLIHVVTAAFSSPAVPLVEPSFYLLIFVLHFLDPVLPGTRLVYLVSLIASSTLLENMLCL